MPPVTYQINGGTAVFGVMWKYFQTSYNGYPTIDTVMWTLYDNSDWTQSINFTSNNNSYDAIRVVGSTTNADTRKMYYISNGVETLVYHNTVWTNIAYKTITFSAQNVREKIYALLTWSVITNSSGEQVSQSNVGYLLQSGQYKIKENFTVPSDGNMIIQEFESNSQSWGGLYISDVNNIQYKHNPENDNYAFVKVLENGVWVDENYKYITISENTYGDYETYNNFNTVYDLSTPTTLTFKHFYDAGLQGTGSIKFRHYSQQEPSTGNVIKAGTYRWKDNAVTYPGDFDYVSGSAYDTYKEFFNFISGPYGDTTQYYGFLFRKYPGGYLRMEYMTNLTGSTNGESGMSWSNSTSTTSPGYIDYEFIVIGDDVNVSDLLASWFNNNTESYTDIKAGNYLISENPTLPNEELTNFDNATCKMYTMTADNMFGPLTEAALSVDSESVTVSSELETGDSINYSLSDGWMYILNEGAFTATDTTKMRTLTEFSGCYCAKNEKAWFTANTTKLS